MLGKEDFIHVVDSKLCADENLRVIHINGGLFITVVPRNVKEMRDFPERIRDGEEIAWQHVLEVPDDRKKGRIRVYRIHEAHYVGVFWNY